MNFGFGPDESSCGLIVGGDEGIDGILQLGGTRAFFTVPSFAPFADQDYWCLKEPLIWKSERMNPQKVEVPKGFVTDFASIPNMFWTWLPKIGRYGLPAVAHDWL